jgi:hypothetical protein
MQKCSYYNVARGHLLLSKCVSIVGSWNFAPTPMGEFTVLPQTLYLGLRGLLCGGEGGRRCIAIWKGREMKRESMVWKEVIEGRKGKRGGEENERKAGGGRIMKEKLACLLTLRNVPPSTLSKKSTVSWVNFVSLDYLSNIMIHKLSNLIMNSKILNNMAQITILQKTAHPVDYLQ